MDYCITTFAKLTYFLDEYKKIDNVGRTYAQRLKEISKLTKELREYILLPVQSMLPNQYEYVNRLIKDAEEKGEDCDLVELLNDLEKFMHSNIMKKYLLDTLSDAEEEKVRSRMESIFSNYDDVINEINASHIKTIMKDQKIFDLPDDAYDFGIGSIDFIISRMDVEDIIKMMSHKDFLFRDIQLSCGGAGDREIESIASAIPKDSLHTLIFEEIGIKLTSFAKVLDILKDSGLKEIFIYSHEWKEEQKEAVLDIMDQYSSIPVFHQL